MYQIQNNSTEDVTHLTDIIEKFLPYSQKKLGFHKPVMLSFESDEENANRILGRTAFYNPGAFSVTVYITGRHPKDVLRSLSHELVHHAQNCRGDFSENDNVGQGYAQKDPHMRNMELEAYEKGNIIFRDFEDLIKAGKINIKLTGEPKMTIQEWKNNELNKLLLEKWGYRKEDDKAKEDESANQRGNQKVSMEDEMDLEEGEELEEGCPHEEEEELVEGDPLMKLTPKGHRDTETSSDKRLRYEKDPASFMTTEAHEIGLGTARRKWRKAFAGQFKESAESDERMLTLEEARDVARRIFERIQKEL